MQLIPSFYQELKSIAWFSRCGRSDGLPPNVHSVPALEQALALLDSPLWQDVRTEAQGDLTGYLAKHDYNAYGVQWSKLVKESRSILEADILPLLQQGLDEAGLPPIIDNVMLDINRAAIESLYVSRFRKAPRFFERLLKVYRAGHLPCGWTGRLAIWPRGELLVY